uniref:Uncharacterized protein n=1 Tax=Heterorhabditis bacteriophora TaxID=37862 RepID=A0A1I7WC00_HETBA
MVSTSYNGFLTLCIYLSVFVFEGGQKMASTVCNSTWCSSSSCFSWCSFFIVLYII